jgi:hypothetical protein
MFSNDTNNNNQYFNEIEYDPEEVSKTRFNIVLCQPYNNRIHGRGTPEVFGHFLVIIRLKEIHMSYINNFINECNFLNQNTPRLKFRLEITECIYLEPLGYCVGIIKTFWIKIIQRTWKKIMKKRVEIMKIRKSLSAIRYRELNGKWPSNCNSMPGLNGMLSNNYLSF